MGKLLSLTAVLGLGAIILACVEPTIEDSSTNISSTNSADTGPNGQLVSAILASTLPPSVFEGTLPLVTEPNTQSIHAELVQCCQNLDEAIQHLKSAHSYTACWVRKIRKYGSVREEEHVDIKIRHEPFSVYMNWLDGSQQVLYVEGQHDGKLLAHKDRGFASLRLFWQLPPDSRRAMKDSRYPVTQLGMLRLAERMRQVVYEFPKEGKVHVEFSTSEFQGRPCIRQYVEFGSPADQPDYARSDLLIDAESKSLVSITNYGWTKDGAGIELNEHYRFEDIDFDAGLTDSDFDDQNAAYAFR